MGVICSFLKHPWLPCPRTQDSGQSIPQLLINSVWIEHPHWYLTPWKEGLYLMMHSTFKIIYHHTTQMVRLWEETCCCYHCMGYFFQLAVRDLLYAYRSFCYTSCWALAGMRKCSVCPQWEVNLMTPQVQMVYHGATGWKVHEYLKKMFPSTGRHTPQFLINKMGQKTLIDISLEGKKWFTEWCTSTFY